MTAPQVFDLAVVGAGPAGLSAAVAAAQAGLSVALIDAGKQAGGQFWRHPDENKPSAFPAKESTGHHHWREFARLRAEMQAFARTGQLEFKTERQVWTIESVPDENVPDENGSAAARLTSGTLFALRTTESYASPASSRIDPARSSLVLAHRIVLVPGAADRQLPVPGWDLPGVMAAGGVQAMIKANQFVPGKSVLVAGTGPFLLPVAVGLAQAGARVVAICEANSPMRWLPHIAPALRETSKGLEAIEYASALARYRIPYRIRTVVRKIHGEDRVTAVTFARVDAEGRIIAGTDRRVAADLVALGWGFTPSLELVIALGAETKVNVDGSLVAVVDPWQRSSVPGVYLAGEATGVGGSIQALREGELAGNTVARDSAGLSEPKRIDKRLRRQIQRAGQFAQAMHQAYPVPQSWANWLEPETVICRCEETEFAEVARALSW
ncbi:opine oxidase [Renibacterium salmoninarum ATCC 33209]|uniref:Opine oxidase n=1 Tax=Renibacterium salmoninarum (strain ATCC 33209 / DSM 20767 / JCM 11484 / NBRC 15589 / NCIMB 2235) TaxID=288705 RepID=A9WN27_RENSM|nr:FAD-dependent oxidoreductase [Renibacterium salmoninarum]ABY23549.1 opine oxidase [Renibacterium salmoninarum ATCC 33209]